MTPHAGDVRRAIREIWPQGEISEYGDTMARRYIRVTLLGGTSCAIGPVLDTRALLFNGLSKRDTRLFALETVRFISAGKRALDLGLL